MHHHQVFSAIKRGCHYNPSTHRMQVSIDVVFYEMSYLYGLAKVTQNVDVRNGNVAINVEQ